MKEVLFHHTIKMKCGREAVMKNAVCKVWNIPSLKYLNVCIR